MAEVKTGPGELNVAMGITAENLALKYGLTRKECDEFALRSHRRAEEAWNLGYLMNK